MSENNNENKLTTTRAKTAVTASIKNPNEKLQKDLKRHVPKALAFLAELVENEDVDLKDRKDAAKFIISSYQSVTDSCTKFALQQVVVELNSKPRNTEKDVTGLDDGRPRVIFSTNVVDPDKDGTEDEGTEFDASSWNIPKQ